VSMAVAALPEGLPAVVTIILAAAGQRMLKRNALVRRLTAIEALGCVTAICSDKTGTLTENHMTLTSVWTANGDRLRRFLLACGALCNEATYSGSDEASGGSWLGDPLDVALAEAAAAGGIRKSALDALLPSVMEFPFDSERRAMTTVRRLDRNSSVAVGWPLPAFPVDVEESAILEITKGAPESVSPACDSILTGSGVTVLDETARHEMALALEQFARSALRVVAIAFRFFPRGEEISFPSTEGLTLAGLVGFLDPPRADSAPALAACRRAGIRVLMLTGDHPVTARAIAEQLGFAESSRLLTGAELSRLSTPELTEASRNVSIYARLSPEQKLWIVKALQSDGQIVAVTGDGVNDAPCLKTADLGIAMGQGGTDVARESASIVLRDNSFASIVAAIREGRVIFANIQRFVRYLFISNTGELAVMIFGPLLSMPMPLMPLQILWINLITDGLPALALGLAPPERDVMTQPPRPPSREIVDGGMTRSIARNGLLLGAASLAAGYLCGRASQSHWQTAIFLTLGLSQLLLALALHSDTAPLPATIWANKSIVGAVLLCALLQFATMQWEPLRMTLHTTLLSGPEIAICMAFSAVPLLAVEAGKWRGVRKGAVT
ncbi:MAG TPA: cation-translocating P-type ATPase, partial [Bryobacteraceae bacterium]|nr:cation-translocating P-type ATPase [Bryobacteraceae bacterium]